MGACEGEDNRLKWSLNSASAFDVQCHDSRFTPSKTRATLPRGAGWAMARSDLLVSLVKAGASGDRSTLTSTVEALVAEERAKSHNILADRLHRALQSVPVTNSSELRRP